MDEMDWKSPFLSHLPAVKREQSSEDEDPRLYCDSCGGVDFDSGDDGFFYCRLCGSQSQDVVETGCANEDVHGDGTGPGALYSMFRRRTVHQSESQNPAVSATKTGDLLRSLRAVKREEEKSPPNRFENEPSHRDFGAGPCLDAETLASTMRLTYVQGLQVIVQLQCEALVEKFGVSPMICGLAGTIWLRYLASSKVFDEDWGKKVIAESEAAAAQSKDQKLDKQKPVDLNKAKYREPRNAYRQKCVYIWLFALRKSIPIYSSLAISFLVCHIAREAVLPTDIYKWASEAKLPYLSAFVLLHNYLGTPVSSFPVSLRLMFRPVRLIRPWQLEAVAGSIAEKIGLHLPCVNFYAVASRYLKDLSLPTEKILPYACRLFEWSIPAELWLSCNPYRLPTRVCLMAILIVTIRILYNIQGQGFWEMTLLDVDDTDQTMYADDYNLSPAGKFGNMSEAGKESGFANVSSEANHVPHITRADFNTKELLCFLQSSVDRIGTVYDYSRDLKTYLKYCKDVIFAGMATSYDEETLIERLWEAYEKQEDDFQQDGIQNEFPDLKDKRQRDEVPSTSFFHFKKPRNQNNSSQLTNRESLRDDYAERTSKNGCASDPADPNGKNVFDNSAQTPCRSAAVERMKLGMEENGFQYLPPRVQMRTKGYLHYVRKKMGGKLVFAAHADYYILLRACAKLAEVDMRLMQLGVLQFERRLAWIEQRIDSSLNTLPELLRQMDNI
ncbi:TATA box-binding protein-associated factor RNA polymerase I subunit B [Canna indica]|uniref:TATA box-binding protein-associated factor RNA polymerase I subunit B n=1 Tax=Canna indica TaxID=4628 RepID=A0AAQ3JZP8_9LILI|nr:TATA box-binding protein-associated factor RNA polymerase I subunit B [Canna indica]